VARRAGPIDVLTVDDSAGFRAAARKLISGTRGFRAVGEASSGSDGVVAARRLHPDLALVDVRMGGMDGIETAQRLHAADPRLVILLVSVKDLDDVPGAARKCGAAGFVRKDRLTPRTLGAMWSACAADDAPAQG
jgi:DNA-binding NarL/FixJ family response regulator